MAQHKIIVGMSGGVDSSVSAYLLQQQGYVVEGLFMKNWEEDDSDNHCSASQDIEDAQAVCDKLGIPLHRVNFAADYWDHVFEHFLAEYKAGRTPNPDILCNKEIKFKSFLNYAKTLGATAIATGHYARLQTSANQVQLLKGKDPNKDQSYFLYALDQQQLGNALFPLGEIEKTKVRDIAKAIGLANHNKKDSTGICFIGERKFKAFLQHYLPAQAGDIVNEQGQVIGQHDGLMFHTIGQRKGLQIGGVKDAAESPWYVLEKDLQNNQLIVGQDTHNPRLYKASLNVKALHWIRGESMQDQQQLMAKTRYRQADQACHITFNDTHSATVHFEQAQRAITPGQSIVFYQGAICLGGGIIQ